MQTEKPWNQKKGGKKGGEKEPLERSTDQNEELPRRGEKKMHKNPKGREKIVLGVRKLKRKNQGRNENLVQRIGAWGKSLMTWYQTIDYGSTEKKIPEKLEKPLREMGRNLKERAVGRGKASREKNARKASQNKSV